MLTIENVKENRRFSLSKAAALEKEVIIPPISQTTFGRTLREHDGRNERFVVDELNDVHKEARVKWCQEYLKDLDGGPNFFQQVLFSDEVKSSLNEGKVAMGVFGTESRFDAGLPRKNMANSRKGIMSLGAATLMGRGFSETISSNVNSARY